MENTKKKFYCDIFLVKFDQKCAFDEHLAHQNGRLKAEGKDEETTQVVGNEIEICKTGYNFFGIPNQEFLDIQLHERENQDLLHSKIEANISNLEIQDVLNDANQKRIPIEPEPRMVQICTQLKLKNADRKRKQGNSEDRINHSENIQIISSASCFRFRILGTYHSS